jgi:4Fe-4S single cluster domain of Ferredoxin I
LGFDGLSIRPGLSGLYETNVSDPGPIHPKNATGQFYVVNGCCTACGVPTAIAPELFDFDATDHCYVKRQPNSDAEMEKAL